MNPISHHRARTVGAGRSQTGTTMLEAALVMPIFVVLVLGLVDIGLGVFQTSQATSAAADGARAGIIWDENATAIDVVGTHEHAKIAEAVAGHLVGKEHTFVVSCVTPTGATVGCSNADPDSDRVKVEVSWRYTPFSPMGHVVAGNRYIRAEATMSIIRLPDGMAAAPSPLPTLPSTTTTTVPTSTTTLPGATTTVPESTTTTTPPPVCDASNPDFAPTAIKVNGAGKTRNNTSVRITATGPCGAMRAWINGYEVILTGGPFYQGTIPSGTRLKLGPNPVQVVSNGVVIFDGITQAEK